jgi:hypothetical protein
MLQLLRNELRPDYQDHNVRLYLGDCRDILPRMQERNVRPISDPPYPGIKRDYGFWTESEWHALMHSIVPECKRLAGKEGSAMFVLQPNSAHVGQMRTWLWEFLCWAAREWNVVQDAYHWNHTALPTVHCQRARGLMRPSLKYCVWLGRPDCYRNQDAVLLPSQWKGNVADRQAKHKPSGHMTVDGRMAQAVNERGGSTPFNMLKISNGYNKNCAGAFGHGAGTPLALCDWWVRYITKPGDMVLDPFMGTGTTGIAAVMRGRQFIGVEKEEKYFQIAVQRFKRIAIAPPLPNPLLRQTPLPASLA